MKRLIAALVLVATTLVIIWLRPPSMSDAPQERPEIETSKGSRVPWAMPEPADYSGESVASSQWPRTAAPVPAHHEKLLKEKTTVPRAHVLELSNRDDEKPLIAAYLSEPELTNRRALTWALAAVGGNDSADVLIRAVTGEYSQRLMFLPERRVLIDTMEALGLIAGRSDRAHEFLTKAADVPFWAERRKWRASKPGEEDYSNVRYAGLAIQALGMSGRPEIPDMLQYWKEHADQRLTSAIADAAFEYDYRTQNGETNLLRLHIGEIHPDPFSEWRRTENGSNWWSWAWERELNRARQP